MAHLRPARALESRADVALPLFSGGSWTSPVPSLLSLCPLLPAPRASLPLPWPLWGCDKGPLLCPCGYSLSPCMFSFCEGDRDPSN